MAIKKITLKDYESILGGDMLRAIYCIAKELKGIKVQHINSTKAGGGVAEILHRMVPLMNDLKIKTRWDVIKGEPKFYDITKKIHNACQGSPVEITDKEWELYNSIQKKNLSVIDKTSDIIVIHDPQPLGLINIKNVKAKWIWRCHIDMGHANYKVWSRLRLNVEKYNAAIFHTANFAKELSIPSFIMGPSIDPLSDKNKPLTKEYIRETLKKLKINLKKPIILQVSRFDRFKDPIGVIQAYKIVKEEINCQLVLAGGAADDDPEGMEVLKEVMDYAKEDKDIHILNLPPDSHTMINALQRASSVILQKSIKEGFGLTVSEALWKNIPTIGGNVGGIKKQIIDGVDGFLVDSVEGCAYAIRQIINQKDLAQKMSKTGYEVVKENYIIPVHLRNYLLMFISVLNSPQNPIIKISKN